jgi:hypothetical protein
VSVGFLSIRDSNATGGAGWYAGTTSTNVSNNLGWIFTAPPVGANAGNFFAFFQDLDIEKCLLNTSIRNI